MSVIFGEILNLGQKNGPEISLKVFGDEHYARYETLDGYTAVYDDDAGIFCYARLAAGVFRSTGVAVTSPPPAGLARHLKESAVASQAKTEARKTRRSAIANSPDNENIVRT